VYALGAGLFPQWHPDWTPATTWLTALGAGVIFFVSLLAHELSHSLMARHYGIRVPRITLFLFGGMAEIEAEAKTPKEEFAIAVVGPLMSLAIGVLFLMGASAAIGERGLQLLAEEPMAGMAQLSPATTAAIWLGSVNIILAIFNMLPGFPLDGGRVFRAAVWWISGDAIKGTRVAANAGRGFGWLLMGFGFWNIFAWGNLGGLWLILIGWFLSHVARASYTQMVTERSLREIRVQDVMRTRFETVSANTNLEEFIEDYLLRSNQLLWPVVEGERFIGTVSFADAANVPREERVRRQVRELLKPLDERHALSADEQATTALRRLSGDDPVAVVSGNKVVGLVRSGDIMRWTSVHPVTADA
ncbi:MAG: site-2 protease family protein, partial [Pseudomonadales bacterium]